MSEGFEKEMNEENEIVEALEETGVFEGEVYFSTDGKHTIHAKASTPVGRTKMLEWAFEAYGRIKERLGTKAEMWGEAMKNGKEKLEPPAPAKTKPCTFIDAGCIGTMTLKTGISKQGKRWAGWFCNENKEHVDWVNLTK